MYQRQKFLDTINERTALKVFYKLKIVKFYKDGDNVSGVFNYFNPLSYVVIPVLFSLSVLMQGWRGTVGNLDDLGMKLDSYWKERKDMIEWL